MRLCVVPQGRRVPALALAALAALVIAISIPAPLVAGATTAKVEAFAERAAAQLEPGPATVLELGRSLLGTPYLKGGLAGPRHEATGITLSLDKVDCMVFLEWLLAGNALAGRPLAGTPDSLAHALAEIRFHGGKADWRQRRHFFSDWLESGPRLVDAGQGFTGAKRRVVPLNRRDAAKRWVAGVPVREQEVWWVPPAASTLDSLRDGDLIGLWAEKPGLDVTHVGVIAREEGRVMLLNASSRAMKVRLEPLAEHPAWKKGILVFRLPEQPR